MAIKGNASYEKAGQRTPKSIGDMQKEITDLKSTIQQMQEDITGIIGSVNGLNTIVERYTKYQNLNPITGNKGLFYYYFNCDVGRSTTITITNKGNQPYQAICALIFTRFSILSLRVSCTDKGVFSGLTISAITGTSPITGSISNNVITLTITSWEDFTMILSKHNANALEVKAS